MKNITVDVAVIGAGTAGLAAYRAARARGARALVIEAGPYGTTCARVGCMPSKLLIAAAEASHAIDDAPGFGVHVDGAKRVDGREVMARVRSERDRFVGFVLEGVEKIPASDRIDGKARFVDRNTLEVGGHSRVSARAIVIATGSRPAMPAMLQGAGNRLVAVNGLRHPDEVTGLGEIAGSAFVMAGVVAPIGLRAQRLIGRGRAGDPKTIEDFLRLDDTDRGIGQPPHGQQVDRTLARVPWENVCDNRGTLEGFHDWIRAFVARVLKERGFAK